MWRKLVTVQTVENFKTNLREYDDHGYHDSDDEIDPKYPPQKYETIAFAIAPHWTIRSIPDTIDAMERYNIPCAMFKCLLFKFEIVLDEEASQFN
uniref:Uncharacterized protein n=1 Tax=Romanomermis culicivorax TaxID=13658 RepID=A0A915HLD6_ROMCU